MSSLTPVTVVVCGISQFSGVKVILDGETEPSVVSLELNAMVTFAAGSVFKTIVNIPVPPASVVVNPETGDTVIPASSLSIFVTETSVTFILSK